MFLFFILLIFWHHKFLYFSPFQFFMIFPPPPGVMENIYPCPLGMSMSFILSCLILSQPIVSSCLAGRFRRDETRQRVSSHEWGDTKPGIKVSTLPRSKIKKGKSWQSQGGKIKQDERIDPGMKQDETRRNKLHGNGT